MSLVHLVIPSEQRYLVRPLRPTRCEGRDVILYPPTDTLVLSFTMHGAWVLPAFIDVERFCVAVAKTLSIFPGVAGRLCKLPDTGGKKGDIYLRLTNSGVPVSVVDDYTTERFPMGHVLVDPEEFEPWVDPIPLPSVVDEDEPLFRVRLTRLHKSGQMIYTTCWLHALGDGYMASLVGTYISTFYRGDSVEHLPLPSMEKVFFPPPPSDPAMAAKFLPLMKHLRDARSPEELIPLMLESQERTVPINLPFSASQIQRLAKRASMATADPAMSRLSKVHVLMAYIVLQYNRAVREVRPGHELVDTVVNTLDYRGNPQFAPVAMFGNAAITLTCPSFTLPSLPENAGPREQTIRFYRCLAVIASSIRAGSLQARNPEFLEPYLAFHNDLCRTAYQQGFYQYLLPANDREMTFNSSHQVDWRRAGDFFTKDSEFADSKYTRFHSSAVIERYVRIFPANPIWKEGKDRHTGEWDLTYDGGLEVAFRLDRSIAASFQEAVRRDLELGFDQPLASL